MFNANSTLRKQFSDAALSLIEKCSGSIQRILPHVKVSPWEQHPWETTKSVWVAAHRKKIRVTLGLGKSGDPNSRSVVAIVERRNTPGFSGTAGQVLDLCEYDLCKLIAKKLSEFADIAINSGIDVASLRAIASEFDENVVAHDIGYQHQLSMEVASVLEALHTLSEQSYESKSLTFGCLLNPDEHTPTQGPIFPGDFLSNKKYKALSDGYRTAFHVSSHGAVIDFVDLAKYDVMHGNHYFPEWAEYLARASTRGTCGITLSRQGDILVFGQGTLKFTYRFGRWQYWNHSHLIGFLSDTARAQHVPPKVRGRVVGAVYRAALDVSFRRSGGLFVILRKRDSLRSIVKFGDAIGDANRTDVDRDFDAVISGKRVQQLERRIVVELASLDGAVVLANSGEILAYGAVLDPKKSGRIRGSEGSRTKAAIGASNYGLAVKISSDGDISVFSRGKELIRI